MKYMVADVTNISTVEESERKVDIFCFTKITIFMGTHEYNGGW